MLLLLLMLLEILIYLLLMLLRAVSIRVASFLVNFLVNKVTLTQSTITGKTLTFASNMFEIIKIMYKILH